MFAKLEMQIVQQLDFSDIVIHFKRLFWGNGSVIRSNLIIRPTAAMSNENENHFRSGVSGGIAESERDIGFHHC